MEGINLITWGISLPSEQECGVRKDEGCNSTVAKAEDRVLLPVPSISGDTPAWHRLGSPHTKASPPPVTQPQCGDSTSQCPLFLEAVATQLR